MTLEVLHWLFTAEEQGCSVQVSCFFRHFALDPGSFKKVHKCAAPGYKNKHIRVH